MTCAYAVRVALLKFSGVDSVDVSLNKGLATVKLKPGNSIRPSQFWEAIRKNGNTPKITEVTVRGEVQNGGSQLKVSGSGEVFPLKAAQPLQQQLNGSVGKTVTIDGTLTPGKDIKAIVPIEIKALRP